MARVPFLIVGDSPDLPTGLGRILGDLARQIHRDFSEVLDVRVVGWVPWAGLPSSGVETPSTAVPLIPSWAFSETQKNWGADAVVHAYRQWFGHQNGILLSVWDPGRCLPFSMIPLPVVKWGYFAVDAENVNGGISGPAAEAVRRYDRVLAYTNFGVNVLANGVWGVKGGGESIAGEIHHLPHGIHTTIFTPNRAAEDVARAQQIMRVPDGRAVIGCVATNHARKDWGLVAQTLRLLLDQGHDLHGWWHVDRIVGEAWSLPQLALDLHLEDRVTYTTELNDTDLARCYAACVATIAPGRGEGFGYPIVESLACGTPVYHVDYGGGAELLPPGGYYRQPAALTHLVGPYALRRPIVNPKTLAASVEQALTSMDAPNERVRCRQHAQQYDWGNVWPKWREWIGKGIGRAV